MSSFFSDANIRYILPTKPFAVFQMTSGVIIHGLTSIDYGQTKCVVNYNTIVNPGFVESMTFLTEEEYQNALPTLSKRML